MTKVTVTTTDIAWQQGAPAQAGRTNYTPGKPGAPLGEATWPRDFRIYTGNPVVDGIGHTGAKGMAYTTVSEVERAIVCDHERVIPSISATGTYHTASWSISGTYTIATTDAPPVRPDLGRPMGSIGVAE